VRPLTLRRRVEWAAAAVGPARAALSTNSHRGDRAQPGVSAFFRFRLAFRPGAGPFQADRARQGQSPPAAWGGVEPGRAGPAVRPLAQSRCGSFSGLAKRPGGAPPPSSRVGLPRSAAEGDRAQTVRAPRDCLADSDVRVSHSPFSAAPRLAAVRPFLGGFGGRWRGFSASLTSDQVVGGSSPSRRASLNLYK
jgi:hypothetical protein